MLTSTNNRKTRSPSTRRRIRKLDKVGQMISKYLELFAKAIGMPKPIERSRYELETGKSQLAKDGGREVDSTPKESSDEKEASTAESEIEAIAFNEDIYILTGKKGK